MRFVDYLDKRNERRNKLLDDALRRQEERQSKNDVLREKLVDKVTDPKECLTTLPLLTAGKNLLGNGFWGVSKDDEPFGFPRGTIRGTITIWMVLTFCIITMWSFMSGVFWIPPEWYLGIMSAIILSYFYSRYKMTNGYH